MTEFESHSGKFTPTDMSVELRKVAFEYITGYKGTFPFMLSLQRQLALRGSLSDGQLAGALNCLRAQANGRATKGAPSTPSVWKPLAGPVQAVVLDGTYTVIVGGERRTLRVTPVTHDTVRAAERKAANAESWYSLPKGSQMVRYLYGPDNTTHYRAVAWIMGSEYRMWAKYRQDGMLARCIEVLCRSNRDEQMEMGEAYALVSRNCWRCGRTLTVPASIYRGLGPICAGILGMSTSNLPGGDE